MGLTRAGPGCCTPEVEAGGTTLGSCSVSRPALEGIGVADGACAALLCSWPAEFLGGCTEVLCSALMNTDAGCREPAPPEVVLRTVDGMPDFDASNTTRFKPKTMKKQHTKAPSPPKTPPTMAPTERSSSADPDPAGTPPSSSSPLGASGTYAPGPSSASATRSSPGRTHLSHTKFAEEVRVLGFCSSAMQAEKLELFVSQATALTASGPDEAGASAKAATSRVVPPTDHP